MNDKVKQTFSILNESSLHSSIKKWYALPDDMFEVKVDGFIVDIVRDNTLIEIQTGNFSSIRNKLEKLVRNYKVILVYPIPIKKWIVTLSKDGEELRKRKSPKVGTPIDLFDELIRIPNLINKRNFTIELVMVEIEEIRCDDGKGSWRRKGISIKDRKLVNIINTMKINTKKDFLNFFPKDLAQPFSNKILSKSLGITVFKARRITYSLKKMKLIDQVGKNRNEQLFKFVY